MQHNNLESYSCKKKSIHFVDKYHDKYHGAGLVRSCLIGQISIPVKCHKTKSQPSLPLLPTAESSRRQILVDSL